MAAEINYPVRRLGINRRRALLLLATTATVGLLDACGASSSAPPAGSAASSAASATLTSATGAATTAVVSSSAAASSTAAAAVGPTPTIPAALAPVTLGGTGGPHLQIWWPNGSKNVSIDNIFTDFHKTHDTWSAEISYTNGYDKFLTAVAANTPPDVFMPTPDRMLQYAAKGGILATLDSYIAADKVDLSQYYKAAVISIKYQNKVYGMPDHLDVASIYQNDRVLQTVGVDPAKGPASWDDLAAMNQKVTKKSGDNLERVGFVPTWGWPTDTVGWLQANGVQLLSDDGTKVTFDSAAGTEALNWVATQLKELGGPDTISAYQKPFKAGSGDALAHDALAAELMGVWDIGYTILKIAPDLPLSQWPIPGGPSAAGKTFGFFIAELVSITAPSKQHDAAWQYVKFHSGPEGQKYIQTFQGAWDIACLPTVANDPAAIKAQPWRKRANELMEQAQTPSYILSAAGDDMASAMNKAAAPLWQGKQDVNTTMAQMKQQAQVILDKYHVT